MDKDKLNTQDILIEIDNLKKYINQISNNIRGNKLESFIMSMDKKIQLLQDETEDFYNNLIINNK